MTTEAVRTQNRVLILGASLSEFMRKLDIYSTSGGTTGGRTRLRNQMKRLFYAHVQLIYAIRRTTEASQRTKSILGSPGSILASRKTEASGHLIRSAR